MSSALLQIIAKFPVIPKSNVIIAILLYVLAVGKITKILMR